MIVATAGHIDHGKTTLVKALTGVDTDRLPEEKRRGISIDLGFAAWRDGDGATLGFVDVPGHERFVRNMLAGVCAIDHVLLVVAADDGVMPQTREHLAIVELLGVAGADVALTKADRVAPARLREAQEEVRALLAPTRFAAAPVFPVAAPTGAGVDALRAALVARAATVHARHAGQGARYVIDRAFTVPGSGTVVTGTVVGGAIAEGDRLQLSPSGLEARVRGLQRHGVPVQRAVAGERCALNLAGVERSEAGRGRWLVDAALHAPTQRLDVRLHLLPGTDAPLAHWTPVHLHIGTADVPARVALRRGATLDAGGTTHARLVLEQPVAALHGDRFVLRDQAARHTLGGGTVLDPWPPARRPAPEQRARQLAAMELPDRAEAISAFAACTPAGVALASWRRARNLDAAALHDLLAEAALVALGDVALPREQLLQLEAAIEAALAQWHRDQPHAAAMETVSLRRACGRGLPATVFDAVLRRLAAARRIELGSGKVRRPGHVSTHNAADQRMREIAGPVLEAAGLRGTTVAQLAADTGLKEVLLRDLLQRLAATGETVRVAPDRYYLRRTIEGFAAIALELVQALPAGRFGAAEFRDRTGLGRQLAILVLESLDRLGMTRRIGDDRVMAPGFAVPPGPAPARLAPAPTVPARPAAASRQKPAALPARPR